MVFQGDKHDILPQTVYESRCQGQLAGWLVSLTLEDEERLDLGGCIQSLLLMTFGDLESIGVFNTDF